jgi:hypothetical protein
LQELALFIKAAKDQQDGRCRSPLRIKGESFVCTERCERMPKYARVASDRFKCKNCLHIVAIQKSLTDGKDAPKRVHFVDWVVFPRIQEIRT